MSNKDIGKDELADITPLIAKSLCEKAFELIGPLLDEANEEIIEKLFEALTQDLLSQYHKIDRSKLSVATEALTSLSTLAQDEEKFEAAYNEILAVLPQSFSKKIPDLIEEFTDPKQAMACCFIAQMALVKSLEQSLYSNSAIAVVEAVQALEPSTFHMGRLYQFLATFDDEVAKIKKYYQLKKANSARNQKYSNVHELFIAFWDSNPELTNKTKAAEIFYSSLSEKQSKLYQNEGKAVRQLTQALRAYLKENPEKEHKKSTRSS